MKAKKCKLIINTRYGHICQPIHFPSIKEAIDYAKGENGGFAYRIFTEEGKFIRSGYCS